MMIVMSISRGFRTDFSSISRVAMLRDDTLHNPPLSPSRSSEATADWFAAAQRIGRDVDLDSSAHALGAMLRRRGVPAATNLLCLALMYGPGRMPLRMIAERAEASGIAHVSEPALLRRLCNAADWLAHVADLMIGDRLHQHGEVASSDAAIPATTKLKFSNTTQLMTGPLLTAHMMGQLPGMSPREMQAAAARAFIVDFIPWPADLFADAQIHWLLCVRWTFVSSHLRDAPPARYDTDLDTSSVLGRTRQQAHLLAAILSSDA